MESHRGPDRLNYSQRANKLLEKIDVENFMNLGKKTISRSELFLYALSLGYDSQVSTKVVNQYQGGLVLDAAIDSETKASMYTIYISQAEDAEANLDVITDKAKVYKVSEQYANTGFEILADFIDNKKPDILLWDLLSELEDQYQKLNL